MLIVFIVALIYFRQELLLCFGLKGLACWLGSFIGGYVLISLVWPPGAIGWMTIVPILFTLLPGFGTTVCIRPQSFALRKCGNWKKRPASTPPNRGSKSPGLSFPATSNTMKPEPTTKTKRPDRWTLIGLRGSFSA